MNFDRVVFASLIYVVWSVLIGYFVPSIETWAAIIAASAAGVYVGQGCKALEGMKEGAVAGLVGGILSSIIMMQASSFFGIPFRISTSYVSPALELTEIVSPWITNVIIIATGIVFGGIGGLIGSRQRLGKVFLFITLFILFIFYGAIDNMVWNWGSVDWTWNMSISHVLSNRIDLFVAVVFAAFVTVLASILEIK